MTSHRGGLAPSTPSTTTILATRGRLSKPRRARQDKNPLCSFGSVRRGEPKLGNRRAVWCDVMTRLQARSTQGVGSGVVVNDHAFQYGADRTIRRDRSCACETATKRGTRVWPRLEHGHGRGLVQEGSASTRSSTNHQNFHDRERQSVSGLSTAAAHRPSCHFTLPRLRSLPMSRSSNHWQANGHRGLSNNVPCRRGQGGGQDSSAPPRPLGCVFIFLMAAFITWSHRLRCAAS